MLISSLLPVPLPPSALSSTPQQKALPDKRVTFFGHLTSSPVVEVEPDQNGQDVQDGRSGQTLSRNIPSPQQLMIASSTDAAASPKSVCLDESSSERKKRRRRKRTKKSKSSKAKDLSGDGDSSSYKGDIETETSRSNGMTPTSGCNGSFQTPVQSGSKRIRRNVNELNEDTESDDETGESTSDFNFVAPTKLPVKRPRLNGNASSNGKVDNVSDSAFDTFENYHTTPPASESSSSFKTRQDTPIVPRVTKNLSVFNSARKIIEDFSATAHDDVHAQDANVSPIPTTSKSEIRDPEFYSKLYTIPSGDVVKSGDLIAFKVLY